MEIKGQITENETLNAELYAVPEGVHGGIDHPVTYVESLDTENMVNLRDLESGVYILYGYFHPFAGSDATTIFSQKALVTIVRKDAGTHLQCIYPLNNQIQFASIEVDETAEGGYVYESSSVRMNDVVTVDDIPTTLPNPHKLTFSGAVNAEYNGSEAVEVVIPQGGGGGGVGWKTVVDYTLTEGATEIIVNEDADGNPFSLAFASIGVYFPKNPDNATAAVTFWLYFDSATDNTIRFIGNLATTQTLNRHFAGCVTAYGNGIKSLLAKDATVFGDIGVCNEEYFSYMRIYCKTEGCFFPAGTRVLIAGIPADGGADA